jgi:type IX secretion system PorP/SprF family membrane protein
MKKIIFFTILIMAKTTFAQLNPMGSSYYLNQYLANPAFVGLAPSLELNAAFKAQWIGVEGRPIIQAFTVGYGFLNKRVGIGATFYRESAGVINKLNFKATYAYHLLVNTNHRLDFGLSLGLADESINFNKVKGDLTDQTLKDFQNRTLYADGDFGIVYTNKALTIQGVMPNLNRLLRNNIYNEVIDKSLYTIAISHKLLENDTTRFYRLEPKIVFRKIQNYKAIVDIGINGELFGKALMLSTIYHSTNSITFGLGINFKKKIALLTQYTTNTSQFKAYSNGEFEIGLKYN